MISSESLDSKIYAISSGMKNPNCSYLVFFIYSSALSEILELDLHREYRTASEQILLYLRLLSENVILLGFCILLDNSLSAMRGRAEILYFSPRKLWMIVINLSILSIFGRITMGYRLGWMIYPI